MLHRGHSHCWELGSSVCDTDAATKLPLLTLPVVLQRSLSLDSIEIAGTHMNLASIGLDNKSVGQDAHALLWRLLRCECMR